MTDTKAPLGTVLIVGGAGAMGRWAVRGIARLGSAERLLIADIDLARAEQVAKEVGGPCAAIRLDATDTEAMKAAFADCDVILNTMGPFSKFARPILEAAIDTFRPDGRAALVSAGNDACHALHLIPGPHNLHKVVSKQLTLRGVQVGNHLPAFSEYIGHAAAWLAEGSLHSDETVYEGLDQASSALVAMTRGLSHHDRVLIRLQP
jgi:threonine dehydrogenase-like Zn-dependent dehydrogenase